MGERRTEPPIVRCRDLCVGYAGVPKLAGVDLEIERGQIAAIVGGSGSGKSTLLKAMIGLLPPISGSVSVFGRDLYEASGEERTALRQRMGMLFQHGALFGSMSVLDNVMFPLCELTRLPRPIMVEMARMKLSIVQLEGLEERLPDELSGGQQKRVALARASVLDPEIIFCDEPTSGLDPITAGAIDESLMRFRDVLGITVVAVTHDITAVRRIADHVVMLGNGGVVVRGTARELETSDIPAARALFRRDGPSPGASEDLAS